MEFFQKKIDAQDTPQTQAEELPRFFTDRALGWSLLAAGSFIAIAIIAVAIEYYPMILAGIAFAGFCLVYRARILRIGKTKDYFIIRMTCVDIRPLNLMEGVSAYIDPTSNTAFKGSKMVEFQTESGQKIFFTYERTRKFIPGAQYDFYFRKPEGDQPITSQQLERLRIDHAIVQEKVSVKDMQQ